MNNNYSRFRHIKNPEHKKFYEAEGKLYYYLLGEKTHRWEQCCWYTLGRKKSEVGPDYRCRACKKVLLPPLKESFEELIRKAA